MVTITKSLFRIYIINFYFLGNFNFLLSYLENSTFVLCLVTSCWPVWTLKTADIILLMTNEDLLIAYCKIYQVHSPCGKPTFCFLLPEKSSLWRREGSLSAELSPFEVKKYKLSSLWLSQPFTGIEMWGDTHTLNVEMLRRKCVMACRSAVIPWLVGTCHFLSLFFHSFMLGFFLL